MPSLSLVQVENLKSMSKNELILLFRSLYSGRHMDPISDYSLGRIQFYCRIELGFSRLICLFFHLPSPVGGCLTLVNLHKK